MKPKLLRAVAIAAPFFFADAAPRCGGSNRPERPLPPPEDTMGGETSRNERGPGVGEPSAPVGGVDWRA